jgi:hypothetical protein
MHALTPGALMPTLLVSTWCLPGAQALGEAARQAGWNADAFDQSMNFSARGKIVFYGGSDVALDVASRFHLALLEPPFDLLARLPLEFRHRAIEYVRFRDLSRLTAPTFVKPADAVNKSFDAGIYATSRDIRVGSEMDLDSPVLVAEPVEWSAEYRCFIWEREIAAWSPYLSFGYPVWKPFGKGTIADEAPANLRLFWSRLRDRVTDLFPPAFVMDVGVIEDRGWAVVEFNPVWCSGLLGADPSKVLGALGRASQDSRRLAAADRRWLQKRSSAGE